MRTFCLFIIAISISSNLLAQLDNGKKTETDLFNYTPEATSNEQQLSDVPFQVNKNKGETITLFGSLEDIAKNFPKLSVLSPKNTDNSMSRTVQLDKDILVKKYWYGKDVSDTKLKTRLELGRIDTKTKKIRIECRDHSYIDGDRVRLYVNEQVVRSNIVLQGGYYVIDIDLKEGFNRIDIEALNQGTSGPNTAEFNVFDENGNLLAAKEWNILTGYVATLIVNKY